MTTDQNSQLSDSLSQALVPHRPRSTCLQTHEPPTSTSHVSDTTPDLEEPAITTLNWPTLPDLHRQFQDAIREESVVSIAELQRGLVSRTTTARKAVEQEAVARTALCQTVFDYLVPENLRQDLDHALERDRQRSDFIEHNKVVEFARKNSKTRAYRQGVVLTTFKRSEEIPGPGEGDFLEFAMAYGFFEKKDRFWDVLWKLTQQHEKWSIVLPLLRKHFFYTHCDKNDWQALAGCSVNEYFTPADIKHCANYASQEDPYQNNDLRQHFSLEFDHFGFVDPTRCWKTVSDTITSDLLMWRETQPRGHLVPAFSERLRITASGQVNATIQNHSAQAPTEDVPSRRSARNTAQTTSSVAQVATSSRTLSAPDILSVAVTPQKRIRGRQTTGSMRKKAKHSHAATNDLGEEQTSETEDEELEEDDHDGLSEEGDRRGTRSRASDVQIGLEYMSEPEREVYRASCDEAAALFEKAAVFIDAWIDQAHNALDVDEENGHLQRELASFEEVKALVSKDGSRLATECKAPSLLTREAFIEAQNSSTSADVWSLTNKQAYELMDLGVRLQKPVVVRPKEHSCSLKDFLCLLEQKYTLDGEITVQDRTGTSPTRNVRLGEILQRLNSKPDPREPLNFEPLNCLDIATFHPYTGVPAAMQHRRFTIVEAMRSHLAHKANIEARAGKQSTIAAKPARSSIRAVDMESCAAFMLLASAMAYSTWHEDLLNNTWAQCLTGKKAWFMRLKNKGPPAVVVLEPGD
ncbi:hypothetical protein KCU65_g6921, partial [Aureobasidium melanogenum]